VQAEKRTYMCNIPGGQDSSKLYSSSSEGFGYWAKTREPVAGFHLLM